MTTLPPIDPSGQGVIRQQSTVSQPASAPKVRISDSDATAAAAVGSPKPEHDGTSNYEQFDPAGKPGKFTKMVTELSKRLSIRTSRDDLVGKNIIKEPTGSTAPSLAAAKLALEKEREKDSLAHKLDRRPSKTDLKLRNILRVDSSDSVAQAQANGSLKATKFEERQTQLKSILKKRPERADLESQNIIKSPEGVDPALAATMEKVKRMQLENQLENMIRDRPTPEEISTSINFNETVEILPTFRRSEYNRRPDTNATFRKLTPKLKMEIREELNTYKKHEMPVHESSLRNTCFH